MYYGMYMDYGMVGTWQDVVGERTYYVGGFWPFQLTQSLLRPTADMPQVLLPLLLLLHSMYVPQAATQSGIDPSDFVMQGVSAPYRRVSLSYFPRFNARIFVLSKQT